MSEFTTPGLSATGPLSHQPRPAGNQAQGNLQEMRRALDRQNLLLQTLLLILLEKQIIGDDEFRQWMNYVDAHDGRRDGKLQPGAAPRACPSCRRVNAPSAVKCTYCDCELAAEFIDSRINKSTG